MFLFYFNQQEFENCSFTCLHININYQSHHTLHHQLPITYRHQPHLPITLFQADKLKRDREQHDLMLRQQQQERERLISEQKRQLEVLRKQQLSMTGGGEPESDTTTTTASVSSFYYLLSFCFVSNYP